jgi:hypothetical protein
MIIYITLDRMHDGVHEAIIVSPCWSTLHSYIEYAIKPLKLLDYGFQKALQNCHF